MEQNVKASPNREKFLVHDEEWFCKVLSENIQIAMFIDELLDIMESLVEKADGKYHLEKLDLHMKEMPEIKYEHKIKKMLVKGVRDLHDCGVKAFDVFYTDLVNLLDDLSDAEILFTDETMEECGETDEGMFLRNSN